MIRLAGAQPIRVHQPTAVTSPPATNLSPQQIDYLLRHYVTASEVGSPPSMAPRLVLSPPHHDYVPIDSAYVRSTNPKLRATVATPSNAQVVGEDVNTASQYFISTERPTFAAAAVNPITGYDFYFPQADDVRTDDGGGHVEGADDATRGVADMNLTYLRNMQPPVQPEDDEPNYYAALKVNAANKRAPPKKFNSTRKQVHLKAPTTTSNNGDADAVPQAKATVSKLKRHNESMKNTNAEAETMYLGQATEQESVTQQPDRRTPKTAIRTLREEELNTGEYLPSILRNGNADGQRIAYQMHGFSGPQSYRFGFDTGKG